MFNQLTGLGLGLVIFAMIVGVGSIVLQQFNTSMACLDAEYKYYNASSGDCMNSTTDNYTATDAGDAGDTIFYMQGKIGEGSGGLASWTPAVIALSVGLLFIGALMIKKGRQY